MVSPDRLNQYVACFEHEDGTVSFKDIDAHGNREAYAAATASRPEGSFVRGVTEKEA